MLRAAALQNQTQTTKFERTQWPSNPGGGRGHFEELDFGLAGLALWLVEGPAMELTGRAARRASSTSRCWSMRASCPAPAEPAAAKNSTWSETSATRLSAQATRIARERGLTLTTSLPWIPTALIIAQFRPHRQRPITSMAWICLQDAGCNVWDVLFGLVCRMLDAMAGMCLFRCFCGAPWRLQVQHTAAHGAPVGPARTECVGKQCASKADTGSQSGRSIHRPHRWHGIAHARCALVQKRHRSATQVAAHQPRHSDCSLGEAKPRFPWHALHCTRCARVGDTWVQTIFCRAHPGFTIRCMPWRTKFGRPTEHQNCSIHDTQSLAHSVRNRSNDSKMFFACRHLEARLPEKNAGATHLPLTNNGFPARKKTTTPASASKKTFPKLTPNTRCFALLKVFRLVKLRAGGGHLETTLFPFAKRGSRYRLESKTPSYRPTPATG